MLLLNLQTNANLKKPKQNETTMGCHGSTKLKSIQTALIQDEKPKSVMKDIEGRSVSSNNAGEFRSSLRVDTETERRLWSVNKTKWVRCGNLNEVSKVLTDSNYTGLKYILINVGVNDVDEISGVSVFNRLTEIVKDTQQKYKGIKVILGEITPRADNRDVEVVSCNKLINEFGRSNENVYVAPHGNLHDEENTFLHDDKHIKKNCIARFAANLKRALRKAYGYEELNESHRNNRDSFRQSRVENPTTFHYNTYKPRDGYTNNNHGYDNNKNSNMEALKSDLKRKLLAIFDV